MTDSSMVQARCKQAEAGMLVFARRAAPLALLLLFSVLVPFVIRYVALAQQQSAPALDVQTSSRDTLVHLDAIIQFYRATLQPIQKIGEPNDAVYRDQAVTQSGEIAAYAFAAGKAEALFFTSLHASTEESASSEHQRFQTTEQ